MSGTDELAQRLHNVVVTLAEMAVADPEHRGYMLDLGIPVLDAVAFLTELADHFDPFGAAVQLRGWQELETDLRQFRSGVENGREVQS